MEHAAKAGTHALLVGAMPVLLCDMATLAQRIREALATTESVFVAGEAVSYGATVPVDQATLHADIASLAALLQEDDSDASRCGHSVAQRLVQLGHAQSGAALAHALDTYDFEAAFDTLQAVAQTLHVELGISGSTP